MSLVHPSVNSWLVTFKYSPLCSEMNILSLMSPLTKLCMLFTVSCKAFGMRHIVVHLTTNVQLNTEDETSVFVSAFKRISFIKCRI